MIFQVDLAQTQTGVGYQFYSKTGLLGSRVTSGITNPRPGLYVAEDTPPLTAIGIYWDCADAAFTAEEDLTERIFVEGGGAAGSGAFLVTITVSDGTDPLQGAKVRLTEGVFNLFLFTDVNGVATFALDAATYNLFITKSGFQFDPTTITVTASADFPESMDAVVIPTAPSDLALCRVFGSLETIDNQPARKVEVTFTLLAPDPTKSEKLLAGRVLRIKTDAMGRITDSNGNPWVDLQRNDQLLPSNTSYQVSCAELNMAAQITLADSTFDLSSIAIEFIPTP